MALLHRCRVWQFRNFQELHGQVQKSYKVKTLDPKQINDDYHGRHTDKFVPFANSCGFSS